jgi:hypothetical protein
VVRFWSHRSANTIGRDVAAWWRAGFTRRRLARRRVMTLALLMILLVPHSASRRS